MANDETPAGFLSRWSRRKAEVREGRPSDEPVVSAGAAVSGAPVANTPLREGQTEPAAQPAPTLADAQQLTPASDFTGFMARGVAPDVKNAALKQLFSDPHFNMMDRMDVYIDDYAQPDPLPMAMLRQMASAKHLNLFDEAPDAASPPAFQICALPDDASPLPMHSEAPKPAT